MSHNQVRARVEHAFARMKTWKILRDCRLEGDGVHHAMLSIARMHNLALAGYSAAHTAATHARSDSEIIYRPRLRWESADLQASAVFHFTGLES